jgi:hypothetical protein
LSSLTALGVVSWCLINIRHLTTPPEVALGVVSWCLINIRHLTTPPEVAGRFPFYR